MRQNRLLNLLARNARKGEFRAESGAQGNTIYLYDAIVSSKAEAEWFGGVDAATFVQTMAAMTGPVALRINCPGGDVFAARAMAQAIRDYPAEVTAHIDGHAASAASFLTSVADRTVMAEGALLMVHKACTMSWGNADDLSATASLLAKIDQTIAATYEASATRRGVSCSSAEFTALMAAETWMTGPDAIAFGLADEIAAAPDKSASARARWDMSAYSNAPTDTCTTVTVTVTVEEDDAADPADPAMNAEEATLDPLTGMPSNSANSGQHRPAIIRPAIIPA